MATDFLIYDFLKKQKFARHVSPSTGKNHPFTLKVIYG
jgi:hypothetical protein